MPDIDALAEKYKKEFESGQSDIDALAEKYKAEFAQPEEIPNPYGSALAAIPGAGGAIPTIVRGLGTLGQATGGLIGSAKNVNRYVAEKRSKIAESLTVPKEPGGFAIPKELLEGSINVLGMPAMQGEKEKQKMAQTEERMDKAIQWLADKGEGLHALASGGMQNDSKASQEVQKYLGDLLGSAGPGILEWYGNIPWAAVKAAAEAKKRGDNETWAALRAGALRWAAGEAFKYAEKAPSIARPAIATGIGTAQALAEGEKPKEALKAGAGLGILSTMGLGSKPGKTRSAVDKSVEQAVPADRSTPAIDRVNPEWRAKAGLGTDDIFSRYMAEVGVLDPLTIREWVKKNGLPEDTAISIAEELAKNAPPETAPAPPSTPEELFKKNAEDQWRVDYRRLQIDKAQGRVTDQEYAARQEQIFEERRAAERVAGTISNKERPAYERMKAGLSIRDVTPEEAQALIDGKPDGLFTMSSGKVGESIGSLLHGLGLFFSPEKGLGKDVDTWLNLRQKAKGEEWRGVEFARKFVEANKDLSKADREDLWSHLNGEIPIEQLRPILRPVAERMRTIDNILGRMLVKRGLISEETYEANKGNHIKYIYNVYSTGRNLMAELGGAKVQKQFFKGRMDREFFDQAVKDLGFNEKELTPEQEAQATAKAKELADQIREKRGLIKDPVQAISQAIGEVTKTTAMADYFKSIGSEGAFVFPDSMAEAGGRKMGIGRINNELRLLDSVKELTPEQEAYRKELVAAKDKIETTAGKPSDDYVELKGDRYGDLNGAFVHKVIADDIKPLFLVEEHDATLRSVRMAAVAATGAWKATHVALNPPTMFRNMVSNIIQMNMSGTPLWRIPQYLAKAGQSMLAKDGNYRALGKQGAFQGNFSTGEIAEVMEVARAMEGKGVMTMFSKLQDLTKFYGKIDDFYKLAKFIEQKEAGATDAKAGQEAMKWGMDYSLVNRKVKSFRASPLGAPFATYQYKIAPLIVESLKKRPWVIAKYLALPLMLQQLATKGMSDDDARKFLDSLPSYIKRGQIMLIPGEKGVGALDISYMVPWGNWYQLAGSAFRGEVREAFKQTGTAQGPILMGMYSAVTGKDLYTGKDIISPFGKHNPREAVKETLNYLWSIAAPPFLTQRGALGKSLEHMLHGKTSIGEPTSWYNAWPRFAGVNIYPVSKKAKYMQDIMNIKDIRKEFAKRMRDQNLTEAERDELRKIYRQSVGDVKGEE